MNTPASRATARPTMLALAMLALAAVMPAHAGQTCDLNDGDPNTEGTGGSTADGIEAMACGVNNNFGVSSGDSSSAVGYRNRAMGALSSAMGHSNTASGGFSSAMGHDNTASGSHSAAMGNRNTASGDYSSTFGYSNMASGDFSSAFGSGSTSSGEASLAFGSPFDADANGIIELDVDTDNDNLPDASSELTRASGAHAIAIGPAAWATGDRSIALGVGSIAQVNDGVALGYGSVADRINTVSMGAAGKERQITNVAAGTEGTDAVNLAQMQTELAANLATANAYTDTAVATGSGAANAYTDNREAAIRGDMEAGDAATLSSANDHADAGDAQTLSAANTYTDNQIKQARFDPAGLNSRMDRLDQQVGMLDSRINTVGALSAALSLAAPDGRVTGANQFSMGMGHYRNKQALSVGYSRLVSQRASVRISAAFADDENAAGVGFNVGW